MFPLLHLQTGAVEAEFLDGTNEKDVELGRVGTPIGGIEVAGLVEANVKGIPNEHR
jgi:hypothetical protein